MSPMTREEVQALNEAGETPVKRLRTRLELDEAWADLARRRKKLDAEWAAWEWYGKWILIPLLALSVVFQILAAVLR